MVEKFVLQNYREGKKQNKKKLVREEKKGTGKTEIRREEPSGQI